mmetsp:Transcript_101917/g.186695  ORF Transcript_101917/g.186695 Transcript_101917/m.186695 type:complete len:95 (+) Transcript_101917:781-1065(+)
MRLVMQLLYFETSFCIKYGWRLCYETSKVDSMPMLILAQWKPGCLSESSTLGGGYNNSGPLTALIVKQHTLAQHGVLNKGFMHFQQGFCYRLEE